MDESFRSVVIPGSEDGIRQAVSHFEAFLVDKRIPADSTWPLFVVLDELLSNVVRHGYGEAAHGQIEVGFHLRDGVLDLTIVDDAGPFNPLTIAEPATGGPADERPAGGLGILFVRKLMDHVKYERCEGRNRLTCRRRIDG
jgi:anti-sigma regulatory factor (Ser/Thr protein kinase)